MPQRRFIDLWNLEELRGISVERDVLRIGALTTYTEIIESKLVQKRVPMLVAASREVGGAQIQNRGTLGGNIANASPAGDTLPVLAAANARIVLRSHAGDADACRSTRYYTGYRKSVRQPDELIVAIEIPRDRRPAVVAQGRHAPRAGDLEDHDGRACADRTCASRSDRSRRRSCCATNAAAILSSGGSIADAQAALPAEITPIDDVRSTGEYRAKVAANLLAQFWKETA